MTLEREDVGHAVTATTSRPLSSSCRGYGLEAGGSVGWFEDAGGKFLSYKSQTFERKVRELAEAQKGQLVGLVDDPGEFAKIVRDNRHYYTHHNPKCLKRGRVVSGANLFRLNEKLRLIFQMCVLADNGIPRSRFDRLRSQLANQFVEYK